MNPLPQEEFDRIARKYPRTRSATLPTLQALQAGADNHLDAVALKDAQTLLNLPANRIYGVASYYSLFNTSPVGRYHLQVDTCVPGFLQGADAVLQQLSQTLGITVGETTPDGLFTLSEVEDLASCASGPVIRVNDTYYENMTPQRAIALVDDLRSGQQPENDRSMRIRSERGILLPDTSDPNCHTLAAYKARGGYAALHKALALSPATVTAEVKEANLRGRGGAGFSAGVKWGFLPKNDPRPVYLVCNADEGEPGTFKDRLIMDYNPHLLIEGMAICAHAIGAKQAFIYIRGEFEWIARGLEQAIREAASDGQLEHVQIVVHRGAGSYVCGEESALIESLEGKRGNPRPRPPYPANSGLYGCPTIVNNVETLANVPAILQLGAEEFKKIGTPGNSGTRIFGVSGHVNLPGAFEYPLGTALASVLQAAGGVKGTLKAVIVGGLSVAILTASEAEGLLLDFDSCKAAGTSLGSAGIMIINDEVFIPELALRTIQFYHHESCGKCVPCREGSRVIEDKLRRLLHGEGSQTDIEDILQLTATIPGLTLCPTGEAFSVPIRSMITKFRAEFDSLTR